MTMPVSSLLPIGYILLNGAHALWHAYRIEKKKELILSRTKTAETILSNLVVGLIFIWFYKLYWIIGFSILTRAAFFDGLENLFRGKNILYEGEIKKNKSWVDWVENWIGLPTWFYRIVYLAAYITFLIIYLT